MRVSIRIDSSGALVVSKSRWISTASAERVVEKNFEWIEAKMKEMAGRPKKLLEHYSRADFIAYRETARKLVSERLKYFNQAYRFDMGRVAIRNQKSRWGSCSPRGNMNFNYKLALLPPELSDYVIVHELCHIGEMNHGSRFWKLVAEQIPDYQKRRSALKAY
jgi:predicted metal-dependent hydrolase